MYWLEPIDAYCERIDASLFGEPLNALSNAAFFLAAIWAATAARRARSSGAVWSLIGLVALIGAGSLAFHVFATRWSVLADVIPITVFIYAYLAFALRRLLAMNWTVTAISLVALFAATMLIERETPAGFFNGSGPYLPALAASAIVSLALRARAHPASATLIAATVVLLASIFFRTIDLLVCPWLPVGTHFLWHLLNGLVLALYLEAAIRYGEPRKRTGPGGGRHPGPSPEA
jgi:hypothetical protein